LTISVPSTIVDGVNNWPTNAATTRATARPPTILFARWENPRDRGDPFQSARPKPTAL
jgi:hypothetical protein